MKKKFIVKIISAFLSLLIALIVILIVYTTISTDNKSLFGFRFFIVTTGSMEDTILKGDFIISQHTALKKLKERDVISFISQDPAIFNSVNTHRITRINESTIYTKGDANEEEDFHPVSYSDVLGKVVFHSSKVGKLVSKLKNPKNMLIFIIIPVIVIALLDMFSGIKKIKKIITKDESDDGQAGEGSEAFVKNNNNSALLPSGSFHTFTVNSKSFRLQGLLGNVKKHGPHNTLRLADYGKIYRLFRSKAR